MYRAERKKFDKMVAEIDPAAPDADARLKAAAQYAAACYMRVAEISRIVQRPLDWTHDAIAEDRGKRLPRMPFLLSDLGIAQAAFIIATLGPAWYQAASTDPDTFYWQVWLAATVTAVLYVAYALHARRRWDTSRDKFTALLQAHGLLPTPGGAKKL